MKISAEQTEYIKKLLRNINLIYDELEVTEEKIRIRLKFPHQIGTTIQSFFEFKTIDELNQFIEPLELIRQINELSDTTIKIGPHYENYLGENFDLEFTMNNQILNIYNLRKLNEQLTHIENQKIKDKINKINSQSNQIIELLTEYEDVKSNYSQLVDQVNIRKKSFVSFKKINTGINKSVPNRSPQIKFDLIDILNVYTREEFIRFGEGASDSKIVEDRVYEKIQEIITSIESRQRIQITCDEFSGENLAKIQKITKILEDTIESLMKQTKELLQESNKKYEEAVDKIKTERISNISITTEDIPKQSKTEIIKQNLNIMLISNINHSTEKYANCTYNEVEDYETMHEIEKLQQSLLTPEEKTAILIYKTQYYRAINPILEYIRQNKISITEAFHNEYINKKVEEAYSEINKNANKTYIPTKIKELDDIFEKYADNAGIPPFEEYKKLVINSLIPLDSAMKKIITQEDIVVYRGITQNEEYGRKMPNHLISTSMSPQIARSFLHRTLDNKTKRFYKITIPAGANALFYTRELEQGILSQPGNNPMYGDQQREVLIDPDLFDFEEICSSYITCNDICEGYKQQNLLIEYIELYAHPKRLTSNNTNSISF